MGQLDCMDNEFIMQFLYPSSDTEKNFISLYWCTLCHLELKKKAVFYLLLEDENGLFLISFQIGTSGQDIDRKL